MGAFEYIVIYILSWWMLLFMILPFKGGAAASPEPNAYHAAPAKPYLRAKLAITSVLALAVTFVLSWLIETGMMTLWLPYRF